MNQSNQISQRQMQADLQTTEKINQLEMSINYYTKSVNSKIENLESNDAKFIYK